jgi:hypothetical protein
MYRYYDAIRNHRSHLVGIRQHVLLSPSSVTLTAMKKQPFAGGANLSLFHRLPIDLTYDTMEWLYLNDMVSLSLTSSIIRSIIKNHIIIVQRLSCSSITRQSTSLLKWCRSLHHLYIHLQLGLPLHHLSHEITNEVTHPIPPLH